MTTLVTTLRRLRRDSFTTGILAAPLLGLPVPGRGETAHMLGKASKIGIGLLFFLHGAKLSRVAVLAGASHWRLHLAVLASTFVLFPLLGLAIGSLPAPVLSPSLAAGFLFLTLLPSTLQWSIAFTAIGSGNVSAAVCSASLSNVFGLFMTPLLVGLYMSPHGAGLSWSSVRIIQFELLAPFIAGHALQPLIGGWVGCRRQLLSLVDRGSILLVVYGAFGGGRRPLGAGFHGRPDGGRDPQWHAARRYAGRHDLGRAPPRLFSGGRDRHRLLRFQESLAPGVPIAGALFPAAVGGVILPFVVFHQIQLAVCAVLAQRYAARAATIPGEVAP